jgi:AraC family transcriptional regulator
MSPSNNNYAKRIEKVVQSIYHEISLAASDGLSLEKLSQVACLSKFHFHRVFNSYMGVNVAEFVQKLRLKKASYQLAFQAEIKIIDIALEAGFQNHESFSRAFKRIYNQSPSQFRKHPEWQEWSEKTEINYKASTKMIEVTICEFPTTKIAALEHCGSPKLLNMTVTQFINWRKTSGESPIANTSTFGIAYNDPANVAEADFRFDVGSSVTRNIKPNEFGVINKTIPGGRCAKATHLGSHDLMDEKIRYLYQQWISENNEELRDFPVYFHYKNLFPQVSENELITDIYLPLIDRK